MSTAVQPNPSVTVAPDFDTRPDTGLETASRRTVAEAMARSLADSYVVMVKTQAFHWNVSGPLFHSLHTLTEEHYRDLFEAVDELAERIRALGLQAPYSFDAMASLSELEELRSTDGRNPPTAAEMVALLASDHEKAAALMRARVKVAEDNDDPVSADMLTHRMKFHEQAVWMLTTFLDE